MQRGINKVSKQTLKAHGNASAAGRQSRATVKGKAASVECAGESLVSFRQLVQGRKDFTGEDGFLKSYRAKM